MSLQRGLESVNDVEGLLSNLTSTRARDKGRSILRKLQNRGGRLVSAALFVDGPYCFVRLEDPYLVGIVIGVAETSPDDNFDLVRGRDIALSRAIRRIGELLRTV